MRKLSREEIIELIKVVLEKDRTGAASNDGHEEIEVLRERIPCPYISDIIYYPEKFSPGADRLTEEEIADIALRHKPFAL